MWTPIITLAFIILVPMIPAYFLFRVLPSTGQVEGALFKGLEIKLGGAFAGYFAVVLLIFYKHDIWAPPALPPPQETAVVWHLSGKVVDSNGAPIERLDIKDFAFSPPVFQSIPGGNFDLMIPTEPQPGGGSKYPVLVISHEHFSPINIPLEPGELSPSLAATLGVIRDDNHKQIKMQHIVLTAPPYNPAGTLPARGNVQ
jgi:hypothetical protein